MKFIGEKNNGFSITTKNKNLDMKWIRTPKEIWNILTKEFNFTVDACSSKKKSFIAKILDNRR